MHARLPSFCEEFQFDPELVFVSARLERHIGRHRTKMATQYPLPWWATYRHAEAFIPGIVGVMEFQGWEE